MINDSRCVAAVFIQPTELKRCQKPEHSIADDHLFVSATDDSGNCIVVRWNGASKYPIEILRASVIARHLNSNTISLVSFD